MRPVRLQLALAYCLLGPLLACADAHEPDDGVSYYPKIGGPIVEFPGRRGGPDSDQTFDRVRAGGDGGVPPPAIIVSLAGGGSTGEGTPIGAVVTGGIGGTVGGMAGGIAGPGGGTTGGPGGFSASGTADSTFETPPSCDAGALPSPADGGGVDAGAGGEADRGCAVDAAVDAS